MRLGSACVLGLFSEFVKLGAVSTEQAQRSLEQLDQLERNKPTLGQVGRYAGIGAVAAPAIGAVGNLIAGKPWHGADMAAGLRGAVRNVASTAVKGGLSASTIPIARSALDRHANIGQLKQYMAQQGGPNA